MRYLLDTHIFLWWNLGNPQLSDRVGIISDGNNEIFLSGVSAWEIASRLLKRNMTLLQLLVL